MQTIESDKVKNNKLYFFLSFEFQADFNVSRETLFYITISLLVPLRNFLLFYLSHYKFLLLLPAFSFAFFLLKFIINIF